MNNLTRKIAAVAGLTIVSLLTSTSALAHGGATCSHQDFKNWRNAIKNHPHYSVPHGHWRWWNGGNWGGNSSNNGLPLTTVECGDVITESIKLANSLNCPDTTGFALSIKGDGIKIDGNGKTITAPNAIAGLYAEGVNISIEDVRVEGVTNGSGLFAYDAPSLSVKDSRFKDNLNGILLYAEKTVMSDVEIKNNVVTGNSLFGLRTGQDGAGQILNPTIKKNDFSDSGNYAMHLQATELTLKGSDDNDLSRSLNGLYLKSGEFTLKDLDLSPYKIVRAAIFVDSAQKITVRGLDVSTKLGADPSQQRIGLDLYKVVEFDVKELVAKKCEVGFKLETEGGVSTKGKLKNSNFVQNAVAGVMISSYDATAYGDLDLLGNGNCFSVLPSALDILTSPGTLWNSI